MTKKRQTNYIDYIHRLYLYISSSYTLEIYRAIKKNKETIQVSFYVALQQHRMTVGQFKKHKQRKYHKRDKMS